MHTIIGNGRNQRSKLQWRNSNFLTHGNCANRNLRPALDRLGQAARFARKFNASLLAESKSANVFIKTIFP